MNEEALILRMVVDCMAGQKERMWAVYDEYVKSRYLHVPVWEILAWKGRAGGIGAIKKPLPGFRKVYMFVNYCTLCRENLIL